MTSMKMQEAGPGAEEAAREVQGRPAGDGMAQMELYRKHGVNPLGSCWLLLLQMPIFMGLYYACRRASTSAWRHSGRLDQEPGRAGHAGLVGTSRSRGSAGRRTTADSCYLGPYFNLLPVIAVGADDRPAEDDDAAADGRAAGDAAEDDEVHDGLLRPDVLQGGGGPVPLLHRQQRLGLRRAQAAAQEEDGWGSPPTSPRASRD